MNTKSKIRTIASIVVCTVLLLPLIFGLLRLACGGNSGFSQFLAKCKLDFWYVNYSNNIENFNISDHYQDTISEFEYILDRTDMSFGLFSSMSPAKIICDSLYSKGGAFTLGNVSRLLTVLMSIIAIALIVIEVLRLCNKHLNVLENALSYALFFLGIAFIIISIFFFIGTSCRVNYTSDGYIESSMKFTAQIGWWIVAIGSIFMGIFLTSTKPHETNPED